MYTIYPKPVFMLAMLFAVGAMLPSGLAAQSTLLYGMTPTGGANGHGAIISYNLSDSTEHVVYSFAGYPNDGAHPQGSLVYNASAGLFYGMTEGGGNTANQYGTIFSFNPATNQETVLWNFTSTSGASPTGDLVYDPVNQLYYGVAGSGGMYGYSEGTLFSFNTVTDSVKVLWNFGNGSDGAGPAGNLVFNADSGLFYGATSEGGMGGTNSFYGTIFSFNPVSGAEKVLWAFGTITTDGSFPTGSLTYDPVNHLYYGFTSSGGTVDNAGTIFSFNPSGNHEIPVHDFAPPGGDGAYPSGSLVYDAASGWLYGMAPSAGLGDAGIIVEFDPNGNSEVPVGLNGVSAGAPIGSLVYDATTGLYYGMASQGGAGGNGAGTIISFNTNGTVSLLWTFGVVLNDGSAPVGSLALYTGPTPTAINNVTDVAANIQLYPNPGNGHFTLQFADNIIRSVSVTDITGRVIMPAQQVSMHHNFDCSDWAEGVYLVCVKDDSGVKALRVVVNK